MTEIFNDNVEVLLEIDENPWYVKEAKVELSRMDTPNYVDLMMIPDDDDTLPELPSPIDELIGAPFVLYADNQLISNRDTNAEEDSLLFGGYLANISPTGENVYEAIAYDPGQQAFAGFTSETGEEQAAAGGSIMNETIDLGQPLYSYEYIRGPNRGTEYEPQTIMASELAQRAVEKIGLSEDQYEITLEPDGVVVEGEEGSERVAFERSLWFDDSEITVKRALTHIREVCDVEWWFDKRGVFHLAPPDPTKHELRFITDADAGKTTPPYQSVRVIGSGAASVEGYSRASMDIEDKIVVEATIGRNESGDPVPVYGTSTEPTFEYHNLEVSTDEQARSVAKKIIEELAEQQSDGTVTVVGFPEVVPMDGIVMPQASDPDEENFRPNQPMGGRAYGVYKVVHHLNSSDGFITKIHVSSVVGVTQTIVSSKNATVEEPSYDRYLSEEEQRAIEVGPEPDGAGEIR